MEISFRGQYDKNLFYKAVILANSPLRNRRTMNLFMLVFVFAAGVVMVKRVIESGDILSNAAYLTLLMIVAAFTLRPIIQPRLAARTLWANPAVQQKLRGTITNKGFTYILTSGQNHIPWENINRLRRRPDLVTMIAITGLLLVFPKRFFKNGSDWARFNKLIEKKIVSIR